MFVALEAANSQGLVDCRTMSSVSKYANLPNIAWDQPDVYETTDLPEADQTINNSRSELVTGLAENADSDEDLQVVNIDARRAFQKFEGKECAEFVSEGSDETPLQQFKRLEDEVVNLAKNLELIQKTREGRGQDFGKFWFHQRI